MDFDDEHLASSTRLRKVDSSGQNNNVREPASTSFVRGGESLIMTVMPNHALQRTRPSRSGCNPHVPWAGSLSLGR